LCPQKNLAESNELVYFVMTRFKYDLTKRQNVIVALIWSLSNLMGKNEAIIPQLQDFEVCGVSATKIKEELEKLINSKVIHYRSKENAYSINLNFEEWKIPLNSKWDEQRMKNLSDLNLRHSKWSKS
jgi:hypothetical protein